MSEHGQFPGGTTPTGDEHYPELAASVGELLDAAPQESPAARRAATGPAPGAVHTVARRPRPYWRPLPDRIARATPVVARAAPEIARVAATSALNLAGWTLNATVNSAGYVARRAAAGESATTILQEAGRDLRAFAWRALGLQGDLGGFAPTPAPDRSPVTQAVHGATTADLQRRGSDLLRRSNDVHVVEDTHPAFARILSEITPDEARILRFVYLDGPQPSLDIRTNRPLGIGSELVAAGLNMIGEHAGLRNVDRIDQYLTNLRRLGLLDFSKEQVRNPTRYQVIEAQPKVVTAMKSAGRAPKLVQRSIRLNSFGEEFVRTCLPLNGRVVPHRDGRPRPTG
ncbi:Abi-alpha family protein [Jatrophihabitans fulvus]